MTMLGTAAAQAQYAPGTLSVKPMVGAVNSTYIGMKESPKSIWGLAAGAEADYQLTNLFGLSVGAIYSQQGAKVENIIVCNCIPYWTTDDPNLKTRTEYINVPLMASIYPIKGLALKVGFQAGFLTKAEEKWVYVTETDRKKHYDWKDKFRWYDFAIPFGISYEYAGVTAELRYNYGLTRPMKDSYEGFLAYNYIGISTPKGARNSALLLTLGYKIPLVKGKMKPKKEETGGK